MVATEVFVAGKISMSLDKPGAYLLRSGDHLKEDLAAVLLHELGQKRGHFLTVANDAKGDALFYDEKTGLWRLGSAAEVLHLATQLYNAGKIVTRTKTQVVVKDEAGETVMGPTGQPEMEDKWVDVVAPMKDTTIQSAFKLVLWQSRSNERPQPVPGLAFRNGFLKADPVAKCFDFVKHSPKNWAFRRIDRDYQTVLRPEAGIPTVMKMKEAVLEGEDNEAREVAKESWETIMYIVALGAFGLGTQANAFLTVYGPGGNGKTTLFDTLIGMACQSLTDTASLSMQKFGKDFTMKQLIGPRFNYVNDMDDGTVSNLACQIQKALAEGKPVSMRMMHKDEYSLDLPVMCIYLTNNDVKFMDTTKGFLRRHYHVRMMNDLTKTGLSSGQLVRAAKEEQMAYVNYLVQIVEQFWADGHTSIPRSEKAKRLADATSMNYERDMLEDICEEGSGYVKAATMRQVFEVYFRDIAKSGLTISDMRRFCSRLAAAAQAKGWYNESKGYKVRVRPPETWSGIAEGADPRNFQSWLQAMPVQKTAN